MTGAKNFQELHNELLKAHQRVQSELARTREALRYIRAEADERISHDHRDDWTRAACYGTGIENIRDKADEALKS